MRLKIFLRGLGVGIAFSAVVMLICTSTLSEDFIIEKAKEYGMVMKDDKSSESSKTEESIDKLKDEIASSKPVESKMPETSPSSVPSDSPSKEPQASKTPAPTKTVEPSKKPESTQTVKPSKKPEPTKTVESTKAPQSSKKPEPTMTVEPTKAPADGSKVTFTISRGMASYSAAKVLEQSGLVKSAKDFDSYLCKNKLDSRVKAGTFTATKGMTYAELAKIITRK